MTTSIKGPKLVLLGRQGSGKGTQGERLAQHLNLPHLSTGDILRDAVERRTLLGQRVARHLTAGELVPDPVVKAVIEARLRESDVVRHGFLLDGFPRTVDQADALIELLAPDSLDAVIELVLPVAVALERMTIRARADDTPEAIDRRLALYEAQTVPVHGLFAELGVLVPIDADAAPHEVFGRIRSALAPVLWGSGRAVG